MSGKSGTARGSLADGADLGWDHGEPPKTPALLRDWKRLLLMVGLGGLSWVATFVGMLELIEANVGDLPFAHKIIIGFSVAMLMVMVVWLLDQIFSDIGWTTRLLFIGGYLFLTLISVGFGFGFYWKVLESRGEASRSAESAVGQVQNALHAGMTRLEQLQGTLDTLTQLSTEKAAQERQSGTSCPASRPGDGPRRQLRDDDAGRFKFAADFVRARVTTIKAELGGLNGDLAKVTSNDRTTIDAGSGTRNDFMRGLNRRLDMTVTGFNAFRSDPQLKQIRSDLSDRADRATFPDTRGGTFQCPDAQLATALKGVVRAIDELPSLEKPKIAAVEGSEAVIEAFRRLSASLIGALALKMPPSPEELRELQKRAVQSVEGAGQSQAKLNALAAEAGLSKRDYIPLAIALFVDLCLLLVSIKRTGSPLDRLVPKMRAAERGPVIQILSRFNDIHRDREIRENFEVFRHVVFDFHGDYYAAVPLNAPGRIGPRQGRTGPGLPAPEAEALVQEGHLLANLFASFEKERIFTRVMSPLLTTGTVQRRLRRQGSKFANAEAFRVYRFRNGAWSEIILGAVMGAAKRVEAAQRRRRIEEDLFRHGGPDLGEAGRPRPSDQQYGRSSPEARDEPGRERSTAEDFPAFTPRVVARATDATVPRRPVTGTRASVTGAEDGARLADVSTSIDAGLAENVILHPAVGRPFGSTQREAPVERDRNPPAGPDIRQSDADRNDPPRSTDPSVGGQMNAGFASAEPIVTVAAMRESFTFTLPVSEARLPASLAGRMQKGAVIADGNTITALAVEAAASSEEHGSGPAAAEASTFVFNGQDQSASSPQLSLSAGPDDVQVMAARFVAQPREK